MKLTLHDRKGMPSSVEVEVEPDSLTVDWSDLVADVPTFERAIDPPIYDVQILANYAAALVQGRFERMNREFHRCDRCDRLTPAVYEIGNFGNGSACYPCSQTWND